MRELDLTERLQLHIEYSQKRDGWAQLAIDLLAEHKDEEGMAAADEAEYWDLKAKSLEPDA
jgi:hypothetical protein